MSWVILRTMSGERFLCKTDANLADAVNNRKVVQVTEVYSVVTMSIMGQMGPSRMTVLEYPDLQEEKPLESLHVLPSAWYKFPTERAEAEIKDLKDSMEKAAEYRKQMEEAAKAGESGIVQARLAPQGPGMPGMGSMLGSLVKPPGVR
jgi:hypothetical protein